ncbi:MAG: polysaccharide biosynthesis C-terminal domain-containing protein, partial [Bacteroidales bacterium]
KLTNLNIYGAIIALLGEAITISMNISLLPVYGYEASAWTTLICYFTMMMVSYLLGRKHYFIPYALKSILFYFVIALAIYFMQNFIHYPSIIQKNLFNSLFLLIFLWFVLRKERITIRDIKTFIGIKR